MCSWKRVLEWYCGIRQCQTNEIWLQQTTIAGFLAATCNNCEKSQSQPTTITFSWKFSGQSGQFAFLVTRPDSSNNKYLIPTGNDWGNTVDFDDWKKNVATNTPLKYPNTCPGYKFSIMFCFFVANFIFSLWCIHEWPWLSPGPWHSCYGQSSSDIIVVFIVDHSASYSHFLKLIMITVDKWYRLQ